MSSNAPAPGLIALHSHQSEVLAETLTGWLRAHPLQPLESEVVLVQSNGMAESFVKTFKRDYARLANRPDSQTVMRDLKLWFEHYNEKHPHSALGYLPPRRFREKQKSIN